MMIFLYCRERALFRDEYAVKIYTARYEMFLTAGNRARVAPDATMQVDNHSHLVIIFPPWQDKF